jgi:hypothetical protein
LYLAWRYGNEDPYRLYHLGTPAADQPPPYPGRVQAFIYACAMQAREDHIEELKAQAGVS